MSGLTISAIREALANQVRQNIQRDFTVRPYPPIPAGPSITVDASDDFVDYWLTFTTAGIAAVRLDLIINPAGSDLESSLRRLDDVLSAGAGNDSSVLDAVLSDPTLGLGNVATVIKAASVSDGVGRVVVEIIVQKS